VTVEAGLALAGEGGGPQSMTRGIDTSLASIIHVEESFM
jgi:hypothetical protein